MANSASGINNNYPYNVETERNRPQQRVRPIPGPPTYAAPPTPPERKSLFQRVKANTLGKIPVIGSWLVPPAPQEERREPMRPPARRYSNPIELTAVAELPAVIPAFKTYETIITWGGYRYKLSQELPEDLGEAGWAEYVQVYQAALNQLTTQDDSPIRPGVSELDLTASEEGIAASTRSNNETRTVVIHNTEQFVPILLPHIQRSPHHQEEGTPLVPPIPYEPARARHQGEPPARAFRPVSSSDDGDELFETPAPPLSPRTHKDDDEECDFSSPTPEPID